MTLFSNAVVLISTHENSYHITFIFKNTVDLRFCVIYQHFLSQHFYSLYSWFHVLFSEQRFSKGKGIWLKELEILFSIFPTF